MATISTAAPRPLRLCDVCYELDDHPRHVAIGVSGEVVDSQRIPKGTPPAAIIELANRNTTVRHLNCCADAGCQVCAATEQATAGKRGQALIDSIAAGALDDVDVTDLALSGAI